MFKCCYRCVPPKRHATCHITCPEYEEEKRKYDAIKAVRDKEQALIDDIVASRTSRTNINRLKRKHIYIRQR